MKILELNDFENLITLLKDKGYTTVGPTVQNETIIYSEISGTNNLPIGYTDEQTPAKYRLRKMENETFFHFIVGPQSWKKFLYPPFQKIFTAYYNKNKLEIHQDEADDQKYAFIGVRACEISSIEILDRVFIGGEFQNNRYKNIRKNSIIIGINCSKAESNCFCTSMHTGPEINRGYDVALTEVLTDSQHYFIAKPGSPKGEEILNELNLKDATEEQIDKADEIIQNTKSQINKFLDTQNLKEILLKNIESPVWDEISKRCLACGNCTMVCPTCFCMTIEDYTDLTKSKAERIQKWDSCFTLEYSYIHGGSVRVSTASRYRQWLTHKLASWHEQFGTSGCVGCGRCITWCPVGIDITEEANKISKISKYQTSMEEL